MKAPSLLAWLCANTALVAALPSSQSGTGLHFSNATADIAHSARKLHAIGPSGSHSHKVGKRSSAEFIIPLPDEDFLGWDIAMSTIMHANEADATVAIAQGQMIANSIQVGTTFTGTVESFLSVATTINYQWTETSTLTGTVTMTIPKGKWGAIVSNPLTHRKRGYVFSGQPGSGQYEYWQADSFTQETYSYGQNSLSWVKGVVTTCLGDTYPLPRCNGQGELD
ncbi:conserved hypothetical protein [Aspergillus terreus NIH2624]|uniref:Uncharacterized protein n=1 Tax=Aspergillus terreus (strain NIH 2624 / FGSC A1156) TaxID=341663 RepID=Q0CEL0_ASPTN|nr:uncharacterized protein ATEG_07874 [Aspergillus terreus NIH2624]EAU32136.1 conserved hypothetical protein [Aspergillus terreus NIH2624]